MQTEFEKLCSFKIQLNRLEGQRNVAPHRTTVLLFFVRWLRQPKKCANAGVPQLTWLNANDSAACCLVIYGNNTK